MRLADRHICPLLGRVSTLAAALLLAPAALAAGVLPSDATAEQKKDAMDHFGAGKQAIEAKNWERAAIELRASLAVIDSPNARLELARTLRESDKTAEAWTEFGRVIDSATKLAIREERYARTAEAATAERSELEAKLAFVTVTITAAPPGATLKVGGRAVPQDRWSSPIVAPSGTVDVVLADASGKELARQTVSASVGQKTPVALDATPQPSPASKPAPRGKGSLDTNDDDKPGADETSGSPGVAPLSDSAKFRPFAYMGTGLAVAGLATFGVLGVLANSNYNNLKTACPESQGGCPPGKQSQINTGEAEQTAANIGLVAGLVGAAAAVTFFVISIPSSSASPSAALVVGPGYLGLKGSL